MKFLMKPYSSAMFIAITAPHQTNAAVFLRKKAHNYSKTSMFKAKKILISFIFMQRALVVWSINLLGYYMHSLNADAIVALSSVDDNLFTYAIYALEITR